MNDVTDNFMKSAKQLEVRKFLLLYELYKKIIKIPGSIIDCGVYNGFSFLSFVRLRLLLEPNNVKRHIYGFDLFSEDGLVERTDKDKIYFKTDVGQTFRCSVEELISHLTQISRLYDGRINFTTHLIKGDATETIPGFIEKNQHLLVSLLHLDFDLYKPTKIAIENFLPRMVEGSIIIFDQLDEHLWPGETIAFLEEFGISTNLVHSEICPNASYLEVKRH